ncbi:KilA-N domain-containing protein [Halomonas elongata]|uniref:KilA-N domain-containing protein n=1 Tax=Halomonas elongata TaxID=2746 RepID=UPI00255AE1CB|nr:KilA-N domain-containing protein [Halomonas elongata]MDL4860808.1 KilA-N domain-containing protein [Halomonas elongata]
MHSTTTSASSNVQSQTLPVIAGHEIAMDEHGRFNLNAIHKASQTGKGKAPSYWTRSQQAKELIAELEDQGRNSGFAPDDQTTDLCLAPIKAVHGGAAPGTFAHELLAVSYAGWISPKFQLQVNQVFLDYRMGKLQESEQPQALPNPLSPRHQRDLQKAISSRVYAEVPKAYRKAAFSKVYRHLKDRFDVAKYDQIDDSRYTEALGAVQSVSLEGEWIEAKPEPEVPEIYYPVSRWMDDNPWFARYQHPQFAPANTIGVVADMLYGMDSRSPTMRLLTDLKRHGYNVEACRIEMAAMRHHLEEVRSYMRDIQMGMERVMGHAARFHISQ